jgi:hypothetical protein
MHDWLKGPLQMVTCSSKDHSKHWQEHRNVRVIDAKMACVVMLPGNTKYIALSYIWGPDSEDQFQCSRSNIHDLDRAGYLNSVDLPHTIIDAKVVCQKLNWRYLWVDIVLAVIL